MFKCVLFSWFPLFTKIGDFCCIFMNANNDVLYSANICQIITGNVMIFCTGMRVKWEPSYQQLTCSHGVGAELRQLLFTHTSRNRRREAADFSVHLGDLSGLHSCGRAHIKSPTSGASAVTRPAQVNTGSTDKCRVVHGAATTAAQRVKHWFRSGDGFYASLGRDSVFDNNRFQHSASASMLNSWMDDTTSLSLQGCSGGEWPQGGGRASQYYT